MPQSNATCHKERAPNGPPLFQNGDIHFRVYHVGWIISGFFAIVATVTSSWLINKHLQWYTNKREQRYIVRLLFMVPIYALISFASFLFWNQSTPLILIRDGYESTVLTSFFYLILVYLSPDPEEQRIIFRRAGLSREADREAIKNGDEPGKWVWPLGFVKWKPVDGLYFLQLQKWGVLQYCVIRPLTTLAAVILDYAGLYCESSWSPGWGHLYIVAIVSLSVTIAMYCLIQLYVPIAKDLAPHKPLLKLFAVKAVVFLTFWQATGLSLLATLGLIKDTEFMTAEDINIGIGAMLETFEMMLFGFLHVKAFSYKPYRPFFDPRSKSPPPERTKRLRALAHAMNFRETLRELWSGCVYMLDRMRGLEPRPDMGARRMADFEEVHGRSRFRSSPPTKPLPERPSKTKSGCEKDRLIQVDVEERVEVNGRRDWLSGRDGYGFGLGPIKKEGSEGLEEQIQRELANRGFGPDGDSSGTKASPVSPLKRRQKSWWRNIYDRLSQGGDVESPILPRSRSERRQRSRSHHRRPLSPDRAHRRLLIHDEFEYDDLPPPSLIRNHREQQSHLALGLTIMEESPQWRETGRNPIVAEGLPMVRSGQPALPTNDPVFATGLPGSSGNIVPSTSRQPPSHSTRSDSVLGRMFPPSVSHTSSVGHVRPLDKGHSPPTSPEADWLPDRAISPLQMPLLTVPETTFGIAGLRNPPHSVTNEEQGVRSPTRSVAAEIVHPTIEPPAPKVPPKTRPVVHRRESALHTEDANPLPSSPLSDVTFHTAASHPMTGNAGHLTADVVAPGPLVLSNEQVPPSRHPPRPRHPTLPATLSIPDPLASHNHMSLRDSAHSRKRMTAPTDSSSDHAQTTPSPQRFDRSRRSRDRAPNLRNSGQLPRHSTNLTTTRRPTDASPRQPPESRYETTSPTHDSYTNTLRFS